jgi:hypothetical protein
MPLTPEELEQQYRQVAEAILLGRVVPFLGAGINLIDRSELESFQIGVNLPSGGELAAQLAEAFGYPGVEECPLAPTSDTAPALVAVAAGSPGLEGTGGARRCLRPRAQIDLARVAQYGDSMHGDGALYENLGRILHYPGAPTSAHRFLTSLPSPAGLSRGAEEARHPLIVTTNYDDLLEQQYLADCGCRDYDMVFYWPRKPEDREPTLFHHSASGAEPVAIRDAANYAHPFFERCPAILKIHGTIRSNPNLDSFVITENDYVTYLADNTLESLLPRRLLKKLQTNHLLFMGYSLQDWNLRVFLQRLKRSQRSYRAWSIVREDNPADRVFWERQGIHIIPMRLSEYLRGLGAALQRTERGA